MTLEFQDAVARLRTAGIARGDVLMVQSNLRNIGTVAAGRGKTATLEFYRRVFEELLGPDGTLVVLTAFEDYARHAVPFDRKRSPSLSGAFSEYIRTRPGAIRSRHPVLSVTAVGAAAAELCDGAHFEGFGYDSAWGRLHRAGAKILTLGYSFAPDGMTFLHYLENLYGVPYQYTKLYDYPVFDDGVPAPGTYTMPVRYLDFGVEYDQTAFKRLLVDGGQAKTGEIGRASFLLSDCHGIVECGMRAFSRDRYIMLARPPAFRRGTIPFDVK
jgi:aminoglycoside 3-N-acetyltransferase